MTSTTVFAIAWGVLLCILYGFADGATCAYKTRYDKKYIYCEYGCCGDEENQKCCPYEISTSVLIVACVVSGLVLIALVVAFIICCYKNYKDKQASRVRAIRQEQNRNVPIRPAAPPKAPTYIEAPPEYSAEMPESHFRPPTASGHYNTPHNQRFGRLPENIATPYSNQHRSRNTRHAGQIAAISSNHASANQASTQIPGSTEAEAPPAYSEFARGQTPASNISHRRFIRTPAPAYSETDNSSAINNTVAPSGSDTGSRTARLPLRSQIAPAPARQASRRAGAPQQPTILETEQTDIEELSAV